MLYTKDAVRDNIRNREGKRVFYLGKGDQLTSDAKDYLSRERIPVLPGEQAKQETYKLLGGGYTTEKPEHMTHLNAQVLVPKTHPRIAFRGAMDALEAELLLSRLEAPEFGNQLGEVLTLARNILRWDVLEEPAEDARLCGMTMDEIRLRSHRPQDFYGQLHFMPEAKDGKAILQVNRTRCAARAAELAAAEAFADREGNPTRPDILKAMNRISSMLYLVMIQMKAEQ